MEAGLVIEYVQLKKEIKLLKLSLRHLYEEMSQEHERAESSLPGHIKKSDPVTFAVERLCNMYSKRIDEITLKLEKIYKRLEEIENKFLILTNEEKAYIDLRYVECKKIPEIARKLGYSERTIQRLKKSAMKKLLNIACSWYN